MTGGASAVLVESIVEDCAAPESAGGGVLAFYRANLTVQSGSRIERCRARWGAGLEGWDNVHVRLMHSSIMNCSVGIGGGGAGFEIGSEGGFTTVLAMDSVRVPPLKRMHRVP